MGRKFSDFHTQYVTFVTSDPDWQPLPDPRYIADYIDHDSLAKAAQETGEDIYE